MHSFGEWEINFLPKWISVGWVFDKLLTLSLPLSLGTAPKLETHAVLLDNCPRDNWSSFCNSPRTWRYSVWSLFHYILLAHWQSCLLFDGHLNRLILGATKGSKPNQLTLFWSRATTSGSSRSPGASSTSPSGPGLSRPRAEGFRWKFNYLDHFGLVLISRSFFIFSQVISLLLGWLCRPKPTTTESMNCVENGLGGS